jgi:hypothetical protein
MRGDYFTWEQIQSWDQTKFLRASAVLDTSEEVVNTEITASGGPLNDGVEPTDITDTDHEWGD